MTRLACVLLVALAAAACSSNKEPPDLERQRARVEKARAGLEAEKTRLAALRDSFDANVEANIDLGFEPDRARAIEKLRIDSQQAVVEASRRALRVQREILALMEKSKRR